MLYTCLSICCDAYELSREALYDLVHNGDYHGH